ncbi:MAG: hypothetical protein WDN04_20815 [Rhodospirillales bacterium]
MQRILQLTTIVFTCCATSGAFAAACKVVGTWTDEYGVSATFKTEKTGTASASSFCSKPYKITVTTRTKTAWDLSAASKKKSCPTITAALTFAKDCLSASGTDTIPGIGTAPDTWTKTAAASRHAIENSTLSSGLK